MEMEKIEIKDAVYKNILNVYNKIVNDHRNSKNIEKLVDIFVKVNNAKNSGEIVSPASLLRLELLWGLIKILYYSEDNSRNSLSYNICSDCYDGELSKRVIEPSTNFVLAKIAVTDFIQQNKIPHGCIDDIIVDTIDANYCYSELVDSENLDYIQKYVDKFNDILIEMDLGFPAYDHADYEESYKQKIKS